MMPIIFASRFPNSSSFSCSGVCSSSSPALVTAAWMMPISVLIPVATTTATQAPLEMVVEEKSRLLFSWMTQSFSFDFGSGSGSFETLWDSPVSWDCSILIVVVLSRITRQSAGTLSPTFTSKMSPGTTSSASTLAQFPSRRTKAHSGASFFNASKAFSALESCQIAMIALRIRMVRITNGSTYAFKPSSFDFSSKKARRKETIAEASRIRTKVSSNCSMMSSKSDFFSCSSKAFGPYFFLFSSTWADVSPWSAFTS
mmetsp:Transcript_26690/g.62448  ORF Transcript_26690/g.62448 Transcript_26690/m.62448 type:complete len:257 (-) Transcript_26690:16-786(-)